MSSSSIEVMSGNENLPVILMNSERKDVKDSENHNVNSAESIMSYTNTMPNESQEPTEAMDTDFQEFESLDHSPGSIIFSPQDMMSNTRVKRGRGRGRGRGKVIRKSDALTIKIEEGGDYSKIDVPVACEVCGKIVANGKTLVQHMATHSDIKQFQCPHCPKSFARMVHLQGHLVFHGIEKQFQCPTCHQRFSRQDCVKVHMRLHDKSKCVFCDVCHKAFLTLGALNIHMRIHRGEKPFKCHLCGKCFTQKNHVITHIKRHTKVSSAPFSKKLGPRMFQCEHCPRSFIRLSDYERHVQWNHGAVADTNMAEKVQNSVKTALEDFKSIDIGEESSNNFPTPSEITLNSKVKKRPFRKVMCTIGTQTDHVGGHVIIPRQYQTGTSMTTTSTQVSAPPTPRPNDDELYETDIFDEGMDRNFSSDEEDGELAPNTVTTATSFQESETTMSYMHERASTSANDEAFDAVLGKSKPEPIKSEENIGPSELADFDQEQELSEENDHEAQSELANEYAKRDKNFFAETTVEETRSEGSPALAKMDEPQQEVLESEVQPEFSSVPQTTQKQAANIQKFMPNNQRPTTKILENFNTKNWKSRAARGRGRGRGRGRAKAKGIMGLTGATHLRLIRKSMINFITEKTEQLNCFVNNEQSTPETNEQFMDAENTADKRVKRQAKSRQHGKDFVCNVKTCETCNPMKELPEESFQPPSFSSVEIRHESVETPQPPPPPPPAPEQSSSLGTVKDQSQKLLQFLISGDEANLQGTDFKLISDVKETYFDAKKLKLNEASSIGSSSDTALKFKDGAYISDLNSIRQDKTEFFTPVSKADDYISPPVELQAFCIPTYSCKLCGREFRFEGKLHRHIESVHQKKAIFSPDVKPGRGSRDVERDYSCPIVIENQEEPPQPPIPKKVVPQNPEIEALRSEWDDDDDEEEAEEEMGEYIEEANVQTIQEDTKPTSSLSTIFKRTPTFSQPIVTREIVPVTETHTDIYVSGVKVNINKISGLAGPDMLDNTKRKYDIHNPDTNRQEISMQPEKIVNSLDTKCRKLLEKLFDHRLLIECGLFEEHVSVVLGRLLQHYGVKMIEDYGQGQYEVLKYNLWRLIEWKVTMEQMEEFYREGKSVEEMMDDIMNGRVPIIAHSEPHQEPPVPEQAEPEPPREPEQIQAVEAVQISDNQLMLSQVANVLSGQLNLGDGVTQVVLAQDVSPEMLQGAHIVTIDPATGQVLSQVTAGQVILADSLGEDLSQQIHTIDNHGVVTHATSTAAMVSALPPGSIVASHNSTMQQVVTATLDSEHLTSAVHEAPIKIEVSSHSTTAPQ